MAEIEDKKSDNKWLLKKELGTLKVLVNDTNKIIVEISVRDRPNCGYLQTILIG